VVTEDKIKTYSGSLAMRNDSTLYWQLSDHLGGTTPTSKRYTGQREEKEQTLYQTISLML
jgi:hypothetical protein